MNPRLSAFVLAACTSALPAQLGTYQLADQLPPFRNPANQLLRASNLPAIGRDFALEVPMSWIQRNRTGADYWLATGTHSPSIPIAALGGWLYSSAEVLIPTPMSPLGIPGSATMRFSIPNSNALVGLGFFQQVFGITTAGVAVLSRGGIGVIGR